jgi:heat-inducible transcriptional repressor
MIRALMVNSDLSVIDLADAIPPTTSEPVRHIVEAVVFSVPHVTHGEREVYVRGTSQMASVWEDLTKVQSVLEILEREAALLELLAAIPVGTAVQIGEELGLSTAADVAMVSTSYEVAGEPSGRLGVIGPMRMDYGRAISAVEKVGDGLGESLTETDE